MIFAIKLRRKVLSSRETFLTQNNHPRRNPHLNPTRARPAPMLLRSHKNTMVQGLAGYVWR